MTHELKIQPEYFEAVRAGAKTFEIRFDDRGFSVGDELHLREWKDGTYSGRGVRKTVTYISDFAVNAGFVVLALSRGPK